MRYYYIYGDNNPVVYIDPMGTVAETAVIYLAPIRLGVLLINDIYFGGKSEQAVSREIGISQQLLHYRKTKILDKLKKILKNNK